MLCLYRLILPQEGVNLVNHAISERTLNRICFRRWVLSFLLYDSSPEWSYSCILIHGWLTFQCCCFCTGMTFCCLFISINLDLYLELRGLVLNRYPQHGQKNPSHFMNISHTWQRLWPRTYRPVPTGFCALWRIHIPLHTTSYLSLNSSVQEINIIDWKEYVLHLFKWLMMNMRTRHFLWGILHYTHKIILTHRKKLFLNIKD
jgi:hypothetical protein